MKRKGISPLIAAVLLIAFTMAVASIFAQWAPQLIQDAQGDTSDRAQEIQACSDITMEVINADTETATVQQKTGDNPAGNITVTWYYSDDTPPAQNNSVELTSSREAVEVTGGDSGAGSDALDRIEVDLTDCEGASTTTYEP
jgi:flagellin-like protein